MQKYNSIEQFRNIIKLVKTRHDYNGKDENGDPIYTHKNPYPVLEFEGTVKLHGTNAGIVRYSDGRTEFQSRERILSPTEDNAGFMNTMMNINFDKFFNSFLFGNYCAIYGEWCGGNIQGSVAINGLPKMFVIFGVKIDGIYINFPKSLADTDNNIYNIHQFPKYIVQIDFNNPELIQNDLINMTLKVEEECPVGKYFGKEGIGEGIVFTSVDFPELQFKSKSVKHSSSKVKVLNAVDVEALESVKEFVELAVSENRLQQGLTYFKENNIEPINKNTGLFLSWVVRDVLKEEMDTIVENNFNEKQIKAAIGMKARNWYLNSLI